MTRFATERVLPGESCPVCEQGFDPGKSGVASKGDKSLRTQYIHLGCIEGNVERADLLGRLGQRLARFAKTRF